MQLALKIDVDTYRGTLQGVPALMDILRRHQAGATFLFSLGPDHTGRAIKRAFRPGFMQKVKRTSVVEHYGLMTLMYGTLLPGPNIGKRCAELMKSTVKEGFEAGIHCWDHVFWQDNVESADAAWTEAEMRKAHDRFTAIFDTPAQCHGAAGWQMNTTAMRLTQRLGYRWASDCRGTHPFVPMINGEIILCPQLPTTLPTLDELIGTDNLTADNVHEHLLNLTQPGSETLPDACHVYTLHAELEGRKLAATFDRLLTGWRAQGYRLVSMSTLRESLNPALLPRHEIVRGAVPGRSGTLMIQGNEFLSDWKASA